MTVTGSLVASTLWHVVKIYPLTRECIVSLQSEIWKFVWSKKPEWVRSRNVYVGLFECGSANY
jgi:hypothetical protein